MGKRDEINEYLLCAQGNLNAHWNMLNGRFVARRMQYIQRLVQ